MIFFFGGGTLQIMGLSPPHQQGSWWITNPKKCIAFFPGKPLKINPYNSRWWLNQPIWNIWVKLDHFPKIGVNITNIWNHHLELHQVWSPANGVPCNDLWLVPLIGSSSPSYTRATLRINYTNKVLATSSWFCWAGPRCWTAAFVAGTEPFELVFFFVWQELITYFHLSCKSLGEWIEIAQIALDFCWFWLLGFPSPANFHGSHLFEKQKLRADPPEIRASCTAKKCSANTRLPQDQKNGGF